MFSLTGKQKLCIALFMKQQNNIVKDNQARDIRIRLADPELDEDELLYLTNELNFLPDYGTIGGGYTYSFTPMSIGTSIVVKNNVTKEEVDLSDYKEW